MEGCVGALSKARRAHENFEKLLQTELVLVSDLHFVRFISSQSPVIFRYTLRSIGLVLGESDIYSDIYRRRGSRMIAIIVITPHITPLDCFSRQQTQR